MKKLPSRRIWTFHRFREELSIVGVLSGIDHGGKSKLHAFKPKAFNGA